MKKQFVKKARWLAYVYRQMNYEYTREIREIMHGNKPMEFMVLKQKYNNYHNTWRILRRLLRVGFVTKEKIGVNSYYKWEEKRYVQIQKLFQEMPLSIMQMYYRSPYTEIHSTIMDDYFAIQYQRKINFSLLSMEREGIVERSMVGKRVMYRKGVMYDYYVDLIMSNQ